MGDHSRFRFGILGNKIVFLWPFDGAFDKYEKKKKKKKRKISSLRLSLLNIVIYIFIFI